MNNSHPLNLYVIPPIPQPLVGVGSPAYTKLSDACGQQVKEFADFLREPGGPGIENELAALDWALENLDKVRFFESQAAVESQGRQAFLPNGTLVWTGARYFQATNVIYYYTPYVETYLGAWYPDPQTNKPYSDSRYLNMALLHEMGHAGLDGLGRSQTENVDRLSDRYFEWTSGESDGRKRTPCR